MPEEAPKLTNMSQYPNPPKFSVTGKRKIIERNENTPAANKYDCRGLVDKTSKFAEFCTPASFSKATRFGKKDYSTPSKGPGAYETANSTLSKRDVGFGKSTRPPINGKANGVPGPIYSVTDKNNRNEPTLDQRACTQQGRHGWYYENPEATKKPGPGNYEINYALQEKKLGFDCKFGTSLRPGLEKQLGCVSTSDGPGKYDIGSTLGGSIFYEMSPRYSFTTDSTRTAPVKKQKVTAPFILQATQFPTRLG